MAHITYDTSKMTGLWKVRPTKHLLWPRKFRSERDMPARGGPGFVVDLDLPWEKRLVSGQERHLIKLAEGEEGEARPIRNRGVIAWMVEQKWIKKEKAQMLLKGRIKANDAAQKPPKPQDLPKLDEPPTARRRRSSKKEDTDADAGDPVDL